jgi:hypothetical protein
MPLTELQHEVLRLIVGNRSEFSHFAGGLVLNSGDDSLRYSHDFDIFHEAAEEVARASEQDTRTLENAGFLVEQLAGDWAGATSFRKARVSRGDAFVEIDWAEDSAFRFYPIQQDALMGWRLHLFDIATNKALALAARSVTRDYLDILELGKIYPLAAIVWAACGKDEGYGPLLLLNMMRRFAKIHPGTLSKIQTRELDPIQLKLAWIEMSDLAEQKIIQLADAQPDMPIGVAFVNAAGEPGWIGDNPELQIHHPSIRGCWPVVHLPGE